MYPKNQTFLVFGLSKSGVSATEFLLAQNAKVYIHDDLSSPRIEKTMEELTQKGAKRVSKEELSSMPERCDALVLSPGIAVDHPLAVAFKRAKKGVVGESEIA